MHGDVRDSNETSCGSCGARATETLGDGGAQRGGPPTPAAALTKPVKSRHRARIATDEPCKHRRHRAREHDIAAHRHRLVTPDFSIVAMIGVMPDAKVPRDLVDQGLAV